MNDLAVDGMEIAPGVVETIVSMAVSDVDGVASVGSFAASGLRSMFAAKPSTHGVEVAVSDEGALEVAVHIDVYYGYVLPDVADAVRAAIAQAVSGQVGMDVAYVDVYIDGMQFLN